jgi:basic membrane lipoprotein Med (substrate-binding protein (PBP1-ABC) superfamily)
MRIGLAFVVLAACAAAGCGGAKHAVATTTEQATTRTAKAKPFQVGAVGRFELHVAGAVVTRGTLDRIAGAGAVPLVVVSAATNTLPAVAAVAAAHPETHFAYLGGSTSGAKRANLTGVVLREDQAAFLGGIVAALVARDDGGTKRRVAWVGPQERRLTAAFSRGAHTIDSTVEVLVVLARNAPAACKEAALSATARGVVAVMAHGDACAAAAVAGSHQTNHVGLQLSDFELPGVAAAQVVREAVGGVFHGGEDVVFGAASGAIGVAGLDPRISPTTAIAARTAAQQIASGLRPSG